LEKFSELLVGLEVETGKVVDVFITFAPQTESEYKQALQNLPQEMGMSGGTLKRVPQLLQKAETAYLPAIIKKVQANEGLNAAEELVLKRQLAKVRGEAPSSVTPMGSSQERVAAKIAAKASEPVKMATHEPASGIGVLNESMQKNMPIKSSYEASMAVQGSLPAPTQAAEKAFDAASALMPSSQMPKASREAVTSMFNYGKK